MRVDEPPEKIEMVAHSAECFLKGRKCCLCGSDKTYVGNRGIHQWFRYIDEKEKWDEKSYACSKCHYKNYYHNVRKYDPDSPNNIIKSMAKFRNKRLSRYSNIGKGFIGEQIVAKARGLKNCNIENDNFHSIYDISSDPIYGKIQVKTMSLVNGDWSVGHLDSRNFDTLFLICMDKDWKNVERVYIIPKEEIIGRSSISICRNPLKTTWYPRFEVDAKPYNEAYHNMSIENCSILKNGE